MRGDIKTLTPIPWDYSKPWLVDLGTTKQLEAGEPAKLDDAVTQVSGEVSVMADGEGTTAERFGGIAKSDSTETTGAAGEVVLYMPLPGIIYRAKAKTASTADTAAEIKVLRGKRVVFDLTADKWTVDAAAADALVNCVIIADGDFNTSSLDFVYKFQGTWLNQEIA